MLGKLYVKNFGPIKEGSIEIDGLTVIIGPQNSGKTYLSSLVYVLVRYADFFLNTSLIDSITNVFRKRGIRGLVSYEAVRDLVERNIEDIREEFVWCLTQRVGMFHGALLECFLVNKLNELVNVSCEKAIVTAIFRRKGGEAKIEIEIRDSVHLSKAFIDKEFIFEFLDTRKPEISILEHGYSASFRGPHVMENILYIPAERLVLITAFLSYIALLHAIHRGFLTLPEGKKLLNRWGF